MTIKELLQIGGEILMPDSQTPELDSELLLGFVLQREKESLYANKERAVSKKSEQRYRQLLERRRRGEPLAYILGKKEFYSLEFLVNKNVLIPRPETEELVDLAFEETRLLVQNLKSKSRSLRIVDVGTGSGCIGIALISRILEEGLKEEQSFEIFMTDISGKALEVSRKNYKRLIRNVANIRTSFVKMDLLKGFKNKFDIIISNPPYIPRGKIDLLDKDVKDFEPRVALDGGRGGLVLAKRLIAQAVNRLEEGGALLFEMYEYHQNAVSYYLKENFPDWKVKFKKDSFGEWRFARIAKQPAGRQGSETAKQ